MRDPLDPMQISLSGLLYTYYFVYLGDISVYLRVMSFQTNLFKRWNYVAISGWLLFLYTFGNIVRIVSAQFLMFYLVLLISNYVENFCHLLFFTNRICELVCVPLDRRLPACSLRHRGPCDACTVACSLGRGSRSLMCLPGRVGSSVTCAPLVSPRGCPDSRVGRPRVWLPCRRHPSSPSDIACGVRACAGRICVRPHGVTYFTAKVTTDVGASPWWMPREPHEACQWRP